MQKDERSSAWITWLHEQRREEQQTFDDFSQHRQQIATINRDPLAADVENNIKHIQEQQLWSMSSCIDIDQGRSLRRSGSSVITNPLGISKKIGYSPSSVVDDWMLQTIRFFCQRCSCSAKALFVLCWSIGIEGIKSPTSQNPLQSLSIHLNPYGFGIKRTWPKSVQIHNTHFKYADQRTFQLPLRTQQTPHIQSM